MDQLSEREAQMEQGIIDSHDEYDLDVSAPVRPAQRPRPAQQAAPLARSTASRRNRRRR